MSSEHDKSAPVEAPRKAAGAETLHGVRDTASRSGVDEAYKEMDRRSLATDSPSDKLQGAPKAGDAALNGTQTADKPEGKDKGLIGMDADGSGKLKYDPNQRDDRMSSKSEVVTADGKFTAREFDGRADGMKSLVTNETRGEVSKTRTFDSTKSPNGLIGEQIVTTDGATTVSRDFDPSKNPDKVKSEHIKDTPASRQTDRAFANDPNDPRSVKSESITLDKATGAEKKTYQLQSGNTVTIDKAGPDAKPVIQSFDANGKPISNEGQMSGDLPRKPDTGDQAQTPPGGEKTQTRDQKIEQDLAKFKENLEKGNELPPLKAGQGPYQAIQAAIKNGTHPPMSHKEILAEARHIRDRDKADGHGTYKVGDKLQRLSKPEMDAKVAGEKQRLEKETPAQPEDPKRKPEQPEDPKRKPEQPEDPKRKPEQKPEELEPKQPGDKGEKKPGLQVENRGASKEFAEKIQKEIDKLPPEVRQALEKSGTKIVVGKSVVDVMPELKNEKPRGHLPGTGWENLDGLHNTATNTVVIGETRVDNGKVVPNNRAEGVFKHEVGHAADHALGDPSKPGSDFSGTPEFDKAYQADVANLKPFDKMLLNYLLTPEGGKSETFAEVFGALHGSSANPHETQMMLNKFPNVAKVIQERLAKLKVEK